MVADPRTAAPRTDLPWLRRRHVASPAVAAPAAAAVHEFLTGRATGHHHAATPAPTPAPPASPPPARASSVPSLDLDEPTPVEPARPAPTPAAAAPQRRVRAEVRVGAGERLILTPDEPTVTLTRLQSGIGTLTIEAAVSDQVGDLQLGAAYELESELESTLQMAQGERLAPAHSKRPILVASHERFERIGVDLRQCRELRRVLIYAFSASRSPLNWGGTLIVTTTGGARIELSLDSLQAGDVAAVLSLYQVRGEFVLRAEMQTLNGDVREVCRAYGYDKITWLDGRTPVT